MEKTEMEMISDPYIRLRLYYSIIQEEWQTFRFKSEKNTESDCLISLSALCEKAGVPFEVFREDMSVLIEVGSTFLSLVRDDDYILDEYNKEGLSSETDWNAFRSDFRTGMYDDAELEIFEDGDNISEDNLFLPLTPDEQSVMVYVLNERSKYKPLPFLIKDSYHFVHQDEKTLNKQLYDLKECIVDGCEVLIVDKTDKDHKKYVKPVKLFYDTTDNLYALICVDDSGLKAYRTDKLEYIGRGDQFEKPSDLEKRLSLLPNVWGLSFDEKPFNVKVRIHATHSRGNVGKKVRKELARRVNGKLKEDGNDLIYEDKVYGKDAFLRWVFGYGSSMVVEKPLSLRKEIIGILSELPG